MRKPMTLESVPNADVHARWPQLPVVLMSGHREQVADGIAGWLQKPFSIDDVVATLDRVVAP